MSNTESNPESENPASKEAPKPTTEGLLEETASGDRSATVVEMSGATRPDQSAVDREGSDESKIVDQKVDEASPQSPVSDKPSRKLVLVLLVLLVISVAINVLQAQQQRRAATQAEEIDLALDRAMQRIDEETLRANSAEGTISEIDRNVDNVQERIADLQSALSKLSEATAR